MGDMIKQNSVPIPQYQKRGTTDFDPVKGNNGGLDVNELGCLNYNADSIALNSSVADTVYTFDFTVQRIVFLINDGPNDVLIGLGVATGTAKKTITLKSGEAIEDDPVGGFNTMSAKLTSPGSAALRFKVVG